MYFAAFAYYPVAQIIRHTHVNRSILYVYFRDPRDMLDAIGQEVLDRIKQATAETVQHFGQPDFADVFMRILEIVTPLNHRYL